LRRLLYSKREKLVSREKSFLSRRNDAAENFLRSDVPARGLKK